MLLFTLLPSALWSSSRRVMTFGVCVFVTLLFVINSTLMLGASQINEPPNGESPSYYWIYLTSREFVLSLLVLAFGCVVLGLEHRLLAKLDNVNAKELARIYIVTLVVVGTLFLICSGYSSDQISPALGLFGTITGYLLGRMDK